MIKTTLSCIFLASWQPLAAANDASTDGQFNVTALDNLTTEWSRQQVREQKNTVDQLLSAVETRYGETAALLRALHIKIDQEHRHLDKIRQDIQAYQRQADQESKELAEQVKAAYKMGRQETLKLMLNQQDPSLSSRMMVYYQRLNSARLAKIAQLEATMAQLEQLDKQKQAETELLEQNLQDKKTEQATLKSIRKQRDELLAHIANTSSLKEQLGYLQDSENTLKQLIDLLPHAHPKIEAKNKGTTDTINEGTPKSALPSNFISLKGKLPWPVKGLLTQKFGSARGGGIWDGVLINAKEGMEIQAVASGTVSFAQWLRGYGYLMIIDHGNDYMTLYAFNQSLYKHKNDTVVAGEIIAAVGQSGGRSESGLYFGIRKKGIPINPQDWWQN
ncbi:MAG: peptidoglycan DD-metalloendopeptidase family protein [Methylovulum sp.]|nr:peptidoglycan DD-metalloendopeptidase family protein [Methylovulum sp.]